MWKRRLIIAGFLVVGIAGLLIGWHTYNKLVSNKELQDAIAEADRLDPGWRLEELEAKRAVIPAAENSAEQILAIKSSIKYWPPKSIMLPPKSAEPATGDKESPVSLAEELLDLPPELQLNPEQTRQLRIELEKVKQPLAKARKLADYRGGRYHVNWSPDPFSTPLPCQDTRDASNLLVDDARLRAQDADIEGACISVICILGVARSIGDEPTQISQLVRMAQSRVAAVAMERILAQGQASLNSLANIQRTFADEESQPLFLFGVRGERAGMDLMMSAIEGGKLKVSSVTGMLGPKGKLESWWEDVSGERELRRSHGPWIRVMTEIVEIAKLAVEEQPPRIKGYVRSVDKNRELPVFVALMVPTMERFGEAFWRNQAFLRCAIVAVAAERYRLSHGHWPDALNSLVPDYLAKVPLDPYDAKPLRYRRLEDGVVIYSIGPDEQDNGGKLDRLDPRKTGTDIGFQLWDVNRRRQPWRPPVKKTEPEDD